MHSPQEASPAPQPSPESMYEILRDSNRNLVESLAFVPVGEKIPLNIAVEGGDSDLNAVNHDLADDIGSILGRGRRESDRLNVATELLDDGNVRTTFRGVFFVDNSYFQPVPVSVEVYKTRPDAEGKQFITAMSASRLSPRTRTARTAL